ncbi:MAG: VCBS repeat-containing protein [Verrucomicrobiales bacterium]|nr:VCBS repeat-containing protein [Verrucomicrobiales bacterium]
MVPTESRAFTSSWLSVTVAVVCIQHATASPLAWTEGNGFRSAPVKPAVIPGRSAGFTRLAAAQTGLDFTNQIPESRHLTNQVLLNGSGITTGDFNGDGWVDVYFCGFQNENALFRNLGDWRFENIAEPAGAALPGFDCTGAAAADLDGDGDLDLVVNTLGQGTLLLINDGQARFSQPQPALNRIGGAMTAALADIDGDGDLDLYVANYRTRALMDMPSTRMTFKKVNQRTVVETVNGRPASDPEFQNRFVVNDLGGIEENGEPDVWLRNEGGARFAEIPWTNGAFLDAAGKPLSEPPRDWGLAAMFHDVNHDRLPDLYVCNDFQSPDRLWINLGGGRFQLAPDLALRRTSLSSMAVDFADINRDGHDDFLVLEMLSRDHSMRMRWVREAFPHRPVIGRYDDRPQIEQNTLQLSRGDGTWTEIAQYSGLVATEWSWSCAFLDVDLDGWEDVLVANGMERAARELDAADRLKAARASRRLTDTEIFEARKIFPRLATPNLAFRNQQDLTFSDASEAWGFHLAAVSQALALADLDNDGDLDVLVGNLNEAAAVYRNDAASPRLGIRLAGLPPNTRGIGARILIEGGPVSQSSEMIAGGRYLSGDDSMRTFATGTAGLLTARVYWPRGSQSILSNLAPNAIVEIREPPDPPQASLPVAPAAAGTESEPYFEDLTSRLQHRHGEEAYDDLSRQPLLPIKLSQPGPGVAWVDLDHDGRDDLVIGAGKGSALGIFRNEGGGQFQPWPPAQRLPAQPRDITGLLGWVQSSNRVAVVAATSNYEDGASLGSAVIGWTPTQPVAREWAAAFESSIGPMAMADIDGDRDLDLFVGGRAVPGHWPSPATSRFYLYLQDQDRFVYDPQRSRVLDRIGNISGATFSDIDGDGDADLALASDAGPIRLLLQQMGQFTDATEAYGLMGLMGFWNSIAAGDFDADGRMDFIAGNWGRNTAYETYRSTQPPVPDRRAAAPLRLYHGDFNDDGVYDVIQAWHDGAADQYRPVQPLTTLAAALPYLRERFRTHADFGQADLPALLREGLARAKTLETSWLETAVLLNRGSNFVATALPFEAQLAPVFGIAIGDANGDGHEDAFLAQNFFACRPYLPRFDGGIGVWMFGNGNGGFRAASGHQTGIRIYGEQRGAAVADFDQDGRLDLVVGQNGAETRLFRNKSGAPGVRIRLKGPSSNPAAVGARLQWRLASGLGPIRELHAGGGCLSQDSLVQVLARPSRSAPSPLIVHWPGGPTQEFEVPADAKELTLEAPRP